MSSTRIVYGWIAVLATRVKPEDLENAVDLLEDTTVRLNDEGTLLFETVKESEFNGDLLSVGSQQDDQGRRDFIVAAESAGFPISQSTIQPFVTVWDDSGESPVYSVTLEKFGNLPITE